VLAQSVQHLRGVGPIAAERVQESEASFDHGRRSGEPGASELCRGDTGVCGPSAVRPLDRAAGAVGFEQSGTEARGDAHGVRDAFGLESVEHRCGGSRTYGTADGGCVLATFEEFGVAEFLVVAAHSQADHDLDTHTRSVENGCGGGSHC